MKLSNDPDAQMRGPNLPLVATLHDYVQSVLKTDLQLRHLRDGEKLPLFLKQQFELVEGFYVDRPLIFAVEQGVGSSAPSALRKYLAQIERLLGKSVVLVQSNMTAFQRAAHIEAGQPFIVPGKQLFMPQLGIALTERFSRKAIRQLDILTPAAQLTLFTLLTGADHQEATPSQLAKRLGYTAMSMGRAIDELAILRLVETKRLGREKRVSLAGQKQEVWKNAEALLVSPVRSSHFVRWLSPPPRLNLGGLSALAAHSGLMDGGVQTFAIDGPHWAVFKSDGAFESVATDYEAEAQLDVWHYSPARIEQEDHSFPLSIYAQFKDDPDERVSLAAQSLIEGLWA
ncbi:helix-turn-helix domain-containing protein [Aquidulcibacter sp.]|uniref:MarR family transcriptional regulator n=1 Tax=Aquidulcibacter sp. TaxID=2052990 RepID=UPI0028B13D7F|nr:helix-turn-helix domain-containing protein [Aquidulcibacter sp.]